MCHIAVFVGCAYFERMQCNTSSTVSSNCTFAGVARGIRNATTPRWRAVCIFHFFLGVSERMPLDFSIRRVGIHRLKYYLHQVNVLDCSIFCCTGLSELECCQYASICPVGSITGNTVLQHGRGVPRLRHFTLETSGGCAKANLCTILTNTLVTPRRHGVRQIKTYDLHDLLSAMVRVISLSVSSPLAPPLRTAS